MNDARVDQPTVSQSPSSSCQSVMQSAGQRAARPPVSLVGYDHSHLEKSFHWLQDAELRRRIDCLIPPASMEAHSACWASRWQDEGRRDFAITLSGQHVGNCGLMGIDSARRKAEVWLYLGEQKKRGIALSAMEMLLEYGFDHLKLNRIYARVMAFNQPALRLFRRAGFYQEGLLRGETFQHGEAVNAYLLSLLAKERGLNRLMSL